jgi:hypothetical protein
MLRHISLCVLAATPYPTAGAVGAPLATAPGQESHPITGAWLAVTPLGPAELDFDADGGVLVVWPHSGDGPGGYYEYTSSATGIWCPVGADTLLLSVVARESDAEGTVTGLVAMTSQPVVSSDGGSFRGSAAVDRLTRTTLDGSTTVLLGTDATLEPLSGIRMWPETTGRR